MNFFEKFLAFCNYKLYQRRHDSYDTDKTENITKYQTC